MIKQHNDERYMTGILLIIVIITIYMLDYTHLNENPKNLQQKISPASQAPKNTGETGQALSPQKTEEILLFASEIPEQYPQEGVAMINLETKLLEVDAYNKYLVELSAVGVDIYNNTSLYTYYIIIQEDSNGKLMTTTHGLECFKDTLDTVKKQVIISMIKALNNWGDKDNGS